MDDSLPLQASRARALWRSARIAVAALHACAVVGVLNSLLFGSKFEDRVVVGTHDSPAVPVLWWLTGLVELVAPMDTVLTIIGWMWIGTVLVTAAAFVNWLVRARRNAGRLTGRPRWASGWAIGGWLVPVANLWIPYRVIQDVARASAPAASSGPAPVGRWWTALLAATLLEVIGAVRRGEVVGYRIGVDEMVDTRTATYLLWAAGTAAVVYAAVKGVQVVRRITEAQESRTIA